MVSIYVVTNKNNGKSYIGKTSQSIEKRWKQHIYDSRRGLKDIYFYRAIQKHTPNAFHVYEIDCVESEELADERERLYISLFETTDKNKGYNGTIGGEGGPQTQATREKMSAGQLKSWTNPNRKIRNMTGIANHRYGIPMSEETKAKISAAKRGKRLSEEAKQNISKAQMGRKHSPEAIEKIRASRAILWAKPDYIQKQVTSHLGKKKSPRGVNG